MSAPAIHPAAIDAALPDFDADVACEFGNDNCDQPAVWRVRVHGFLPSSPECANHTLCLCDTHQVVQRDKIENILWPGPFRCTGCERICRQVSDVILSVVAL
ncbi:tail fiber protein [Gordonia phage Yeet412]|nr:tail fiber protein [Gordonia phage Kita]YP_010653086.1 tail fiber protein [Gordonia phage Polly]YP_010653547.1 tail fiber protein [Gordonia phage Pickett]YP_010653623.1 tail fiber protein [Gordonia phage Yeet412]QCG77474.1 hypothetical protein SEA_ANTONIO_55 [Gordonia phage Antonio]QCW22456.1 hypothetical protein SEA_TAYONIA_55 [Gordonia phage Tayonia]QDF16536.1 hypothetical protein SEA_ZAMEEN_55 [Gordonia phage Zameen]QDF18372.1 hypothetical protein SEA_LORDFARQUAAD_52 [Gordonia phage Lo